MTNAFHVAPGELKDRLSSEVLSEAFIGARDVKAFNHLASEQLGTNPSVQRQRQVVFVSSNDADASNCRGPSNSAWIAPIKIGRLDQGGVPLHVVGSKPGGLLLQNLVKLG